MAIAALGDDPDELDEGIASFRELAAAGAMLDSRWEFALDRAGYDVLKVHRARTEKWLVDAVGR